MTSVPQAVDASASRFNRVAADSLHIAARRVLAARHYAGCCASMAGTVPVRTFGAFTAVFEPYHRSTYWWPKPSTKNKARASNGKTYKPSEARCLALLLMAEMIRTGDV